MISETAIQLLIDKLGKENVITAAEDLLVLGYDSTPGLHATPDLVVYPTDSEQVQSVMQVARDHKAADHPSWQWHRPFRWQHPDQWRHRHLPEQDEQDP